ncbi:MAG: hypothetical protein WC506_06745 [Candidatus Micrarchaeia archaeon]
MMRIELDKDSYMPGETVKATVKYSFSSPVSARKLEASLVCMERKQVKTHTVMDQDDYRIEKELGIPKSTNIKTETSEQSSTAFSQKKELGGQNIYTNGQAEVSFELPQDAPATSHEFGHDGKIHVWTLSVKLDIPMAFDKNASKEVFVGGLLEH